MASTKLYFDTRNKRADVFPVCVCVSANNRTTLVQTGVHLRRDQWKNGQVINRPDKARLNAVLRGFFARVEDCVIRLQQGQEIKRMTPAQIKAAVLQALNPDAEAQKVTFSAIANRFIQLRNTRTRELYTNTLHKIAAFCDLDVLTFEDVGLAWLEDFRAFYEAQGQAVNTIAIDLRNIRAIFNYARKLGVTKEYPFITYKIEREQTRHRNLSPVMLCALRNWPVEEHERKYRDVALLIFYLLGINIVDLCNARPTDIINGRLEYRRHKTKKLYSVWIHPRAAEILNRYKGNDFLLSVMDGRTSYKSFAKQLNRNLQQIGTCKRVGRGGRKIRTPLLPEATTYWFRHTWATLAHLAGVPKDVISLALGHSFGVDVTDTYIDYDAGKVDDANRRVIDYLDEIEKGEEYAQLMEKYGVFPQ